MIITVTLNAAIDKSLSVPNFRLGRRHRTVEQRTMAGGKGVNIARTLKELGQPVIATGFAGGATGTHIVEQLTEESILNDFVRIREESRTNTSVLDPTTGEQTEINARGPSVSPREAIMTLPDGCFAQVLVNGQARLKRVRVEPREPIAKRGSGDAFLAGYLAARYEGRPPDQCLRFGVACGAESTGRFGAGLIDPREARRLMGEVELSDVELPAEVT